MHPLAQVLECVQLGNCRLERRASLRGLLVVGGLGQRRLGIAFRRMVSVLDDVDTIGDPENILLVVKEGRAVGNRGGFSVG